LGKEAEALVNGFDGVVVLLDLGLEFFMLVLSLLGFNFEVVSVLGDVVLELGNVVVDAVSLGDEDVVNQVVSVEEISGSAVDFLLESDDFSVVLVGSSGEVLLDLSQFGVQIINKLVNGVQQLLEGSLGLEVDLGEVNDPASPLGSLDLGQ